MYTHARWHSEGLRWIASLFLLAAERLEREARADAAPADPSPEERIEEARSRLYSRYC